MCFLDSWWLNRIQPKVRKDTCIEDLWRSVAEEMKVMWPISRRREMLFECKQKQGQAVSDFYLELKTLAQDCEITKLGPEPLLCHLLVLSWDIDVGHVRGEVGEGRGPHPSSQDPDRKLCEIVAGNNHQQLVPGTYCY